MRLEDLAEAARRYKRIGEEITELENDRKVLRVRVVAEMARRKRETLSTGGVTITLNSRRTGIDLDKLRERVRAGVFRKVTKLTTDSDAIKLALKHDELTEADLEACEQRGSKFPTVTLEAAAA